MTKTRFLVKIELTILMIDPDKNQSKILEPEIMNFYNCQLDGSEERRYLGVPNSPNITFKGRYIFNQIKIAKHYNKTPYEKIGGLFSLCFKYVGDRKYHGHL